MKSICFFLVLANILLFSNQAHSIPEMEPNSDPVVLTQLSKSMIAKGLREGDKVISINGESYLTMLQKMTLLYRTPGRKVVVLERDGKTIEVVYTVEKKK